MVSKDALLSRRRRAGFNLTVDLIEWNVFFNVCFCYFRFKNVQSRVDQTMPKAMVAATHWFFFYNCMKLICDAYTPFITQGVRWLSEFISQSADEDFFLCWLCTSIKCGYIHSVMNLHICIGIILMCRCIII